MVFINDSFLDYDDCFKRCVYDQMVTSSVEGIPQEDCEKCCKGNYDGKLFMIEDCLNKPNK